MPRVSPIITNFSSGEWSQRQKGRVDQQMYYNACEELVNMVAHTSGGAMRVPGTVYAGLTKNANAQVRLIPFGVSPTNAVPYFLEFGALYCRVHDADGDAVGSDLTTSFTVADVQEIQYVQSQSTMFLVHRSRPVHKITCAAGPVFTCVQKTGADVFTHGGSDEGFDATDHYPRAVGFFEGRLLLGGTNTGRQKIWGSKNTSFEDFTIGTSDTAAFAFTIDLETAFTIVGMATKGDVHLFTDQGEVLFSGLKKPITATNFSFRWQSTYTAAPVQPVKISDAILYLQGGGRKLRAHFYSTQTETQISPDLTYYSDHVLGYGCVELAVQRKPFPIVWALRSDGVLAALSYDREANVYAWSRYVRDDGEIESICVLPDPDGVGEDRLVMAIDRTRASGLYDLEYMETWTPGISLGLAYAGQQSSFFFVNNGLSVEFGTAKVVSGATQAKPIVLTLASTTGFSSSGFCYIEGVLGMIELNGKVFMTKNITGTTVDLWREDGTDEYNGTTFGAYTSGGTATPVTKTVPGFDHLDGETVQVWADGARQPNCEVVSGDVTLDRYAAFITAGLGYAPRLKPMPLEGGSATGTSQGKLKGVFRMAIRFLETFGAKVGPDDDNLDDITFEEGDRPMDEPPAMFTGDKAQTYNCKWGYTGEILITQEGPFPMNILALMPVMETNE